MFHKLEAFLDHPSSHTDKNIKIGSNRVKNAFTSTTVVEHPAASNKDVNAPENCRRSLPEKRKKSIYDVRENILSLIFCVLCLFCLPKLLFFKKIFFTTFITFYLLFKIYMLFEVSFQIYSKIVWIHFQVFFI